MKKGEIIYAVLLLILLVFFIISMLPKKEPAHCSDGILNVFEEHTDCGGECISCVEKYPMFYGNPQRKNYIPLAAVLVIFLYTAGAIILLKRNRTNVRLIVEDLFEEANEALKDDLHRATAAYHRIKVHYSTLPKEQREEIYYRALALYNKIRQKRKEQ